MSKVPAGAEQLVPGVTNRRRFITHLGLTGLGVLGATQIGKLGSLAAADELAEVSAEAVTQRDIDILNFALNLEYLEGEYYLRAAFGRGLGNGDTDGTGNRGGVTGGRKVNFQTNAVRDYAEELARDEEAHVKFIRGALGDLAVARPTIDLDQSFTNAAIAAGLIRAGQTFDPFADEDSFLIGAYIFEDVGVTAYKGAAKLLTDKTVLEAAAGILAVEAYHAGMIRTVLYSRGLFEASKAISDLRDAADGTGDRDQPIRLRLKANIVPADTNGIAYSRNATQVLNIVYLGGEAANFGFFPDRLNGDIR
jgi:hypothetical protein